MFAYTNIEVDRLNAELRQVRRDRGELASPDTVLETKHGDAAFAVGDRVQFTDTAKKLGIANGNAGTLTGLDAITGQVWERLDAPAGKEGRLVSWPAAEFVGFRHGYAGTIYKGQGKTLDHTYLLHTHHWRAAASYVALTRQRESAQVFVATETARDVHQLVRQMARGEVRGASVAWATHDEVAPELRRAGETLGTGNPVRQDERLPTRAAASSSPATAEAAYEGPAEGWLIPPRVSPDGRDSLGRGLDAGSIAAAVAASAAVRREREARWSYLQGAYRDPYAARAALDELAKREGWTSTAARIARAPEQLGDLRGKVGLLVSAAAKQERASAERAAGALPASLIRIAEAETHAERIYRTSVEAQRAAAATGIPRLSTATEAAIAGLRAASDEKTRAEAWQAIQKDDRAAGELSAFETAIAKRLGDDGVRAMLRATSQAVPVIASSVAPEHQRGLDQAAQLLATLRQGARAGAALAQRESDSQGLRQRR